MRHHYLRACNAAQSVRSATTRRIKPEERANSPAILFASLLAAAFITIHRLLCIGRWFFLSVLLTFSPLSENMVCRPFSPAPAEDNRVRSSVAYSRPPAKRNSRREKNQKEWGDRRRAVGLAIIEGTGSHRMAGWPPSQSRYYTASRGVTKVVLVKHSGDESHAKPQRSRKRVRYRHHPSRNGASSFDVIQPQDSPRATIGPGGLGSHAGRHR
jgi:hypothetical protein